MKKKLNIFLFILLLILWSAVIYKYTGHFFFRNYQPATKNSSAAFKSKMYQKDTFDMKPVERDPFLSKSFAPAKIKSASKNNGHKKKTAETRTAPLINFPPVSYHGYIKSENREKKLVLVKINNKLYKLKVGEIQDGVEVLVATKDSLEISFNNVNKNIKKS